jgi:hypothetical protein
MDGWMDGWTGVKIVLRDCLPQSKIEIENCPLVGVHVGEFLISILIFPCYFVTTFNVGAFSL